MIIVLGGTLPSVVIAWTVSMAVRHPDGQKRYPYTLHLALLTFFFFFSFLGPTTPRPGSLGGRIDRLLFVLGFARAMAAGSAGPSLLRRRWQALGGVGLLRPVERPGGLYRAGGGRCRASGDGWRSASRRRYAPLAFKDRRGIWVFEVAGHDRVKLGPRRGPRRRCQFVVVVGGGAVGLSQRECTLEFRSGIGKRMGRR